MASIQGEFSNSKWMGSKIEYTEQNVNAQDNTSEVKVDFYLLSLNGGSGKFTGARDAIIKVDNQEKIIHVNAWEIGKDQTTYFGTATFVIPHNENGSKTVEISSHYDTSYDPIGYSNLSTNFELTTIQRVSDLTCENGYIQDNVNIRVNRYNESFTHTVTYSFKDTTGIIATKSSETLLNWTIPSSFYEKMPNEASASCKVICTTYNHDTVIGTKECNIQVGVDPSLNKPLVEVTLMDNNLKTLDLTGNNQTLVKGFSDVSYNIKATAKNYTTIKSYQVNNEESILTTPVGVIEKVESGNFEITVVDHRDIATVVNKTLTMIDYQKPQFNEVKIARVDRTSKTVYVECNGNFFGGNFGNVDNLLQLKYRYREVEGEWSNLLELTPTKDNNDFLLNKTNLAQEFDENKRYEFELFLTDKIYDQSTESLTIKVEKTVSKGNPVFIEGDDKAVFPCNLYYENKDLLDLIYPINHPFLSYSSANPATYLGFGEWELSSKGRALIGVDPDNEKYNQSGLHVGSETVRLMLDHMPYHSHLVRLHSLEVQKGYGTWVTQALDDGGNVWTHAVGADHSHDNVSPGETIYVWNRIA